MGRIAHMSVAPPLAIWGKAVGAHRSLLLVIRHALQVAWLMSGAFSPPHRSDNDPPEIT
ncbi:hypothetical protein [Yoonia sp.]|uniref:hypothetical protein n=1 Tax=Yoonia sp. TaxID=2212373 RepID=UPI0025D80A13|nr:hypothetical protein [Yoonia sp.]